MSERFLKFRAGHVLHTLGACFGKCSKPRAPLGALGRNESIADSDYATPRYEEREKNSKKRPSLVVVTPVVFHAKETEAPQRRYVHWYVCVLVVSLLLVRLFGISRREVMQLCRSVCIFVMDF